jgi:hypothetical protein
MNTLVRTLEKVLELERKERARRTAKRKLERRFDDAEREALAEKLMGLQREILAERARSLQARLMLREQRMLNRDWRMWGRLGKQLPPDDQDWRSSRRRR